MGRSHRRTAPPRSRRTQLGLIAVTAATLLMMAWAIFPSSAYSTPNGELPKGRIFIQKVTVPSGDPTEFQFVGAFNTFLSDGEGSVRTVDPGTYSVSEVVPAGWAIPSISCDDNNSSGSGTTATFNVEPGEEVKCTFTNSKTPVTTTTPPPTTTTPPPTTTTPPPTTTTPPPTTTTPPPTTTTPPPTTTTPPPTTTTPPPTTTEPPTTTTEPPPPTTEPPTVEPTTVEPSEDPTTTTPPGGTAFTGIQNVVPLGAIALILLTTGSGLMWAGSRRRKTDGDAD